MIVERYTDPDGTFAYKRALADGFNAATLAMILAPEPTSSAVGLAARGIAGAGKTLYGAIRNPKQTLDKGLEAIGKLKSRRQQGNRFNNPVSSPQSTSNLPTPPNYFKDIGSETLKNAVNPALRIAGVTYLANQALPDGEETITEEEIETPEQMEARIRREEQEKYQKQLNELKSLAGAKKTENKGDYRDLVRLGAGIMSAKNIGDIGTAVTGVLDAQDKRGLVGLQGKLTKAQTLKLEADIASMDKNSILARMTNLTKALEAGLITDIEAAQVQYSALAAKLAELEGQETKPASEDSNVIASYG